MTIILVPKEDRIDIPRRFNKKRITDLHTDLHTDIHTNINEDNNTNHKLKFIKPEDCISIKKAWAVKRTAKEKGLKAAWAKKMNKKTEA